MIGAASLMLVERQCIICGGVSVVHSATFGLPLVCSLAFQNGSSIRP